MRTIDLSLVVTLVGLIFTMGVAWQKAESRADRLQEQVNTLKHILVSEFPRYSPAIDWRN